MMARLSLLLPLLLLVLALLEPRSALGEAETTTTTTSAVASGTAADKDKKCPVLCELNTEYCKYVKLTDRCAIKGCGPVVKCQVMTQCPINCLKVCTPPRIFGCS